MDYAAYPLLPIKRSLASRFNWQFRAAIANNIEQAVQLQIAEFERKALVRTLFSEIHSALTTHFYSVGKGWK